MKDKESLRRLYEMGKEMCEMAKSMGYQEEEGMKDEDESYESKEESGFGPESMPVGGNKKVEMALELFGKK